MPAVPEFLFLYGTLQPGRAGRQHRPLTARLGQGRPARVRGHLYDLGEFPAAVPDPAARSWVHGIAVPVPRADDLAALDVYEGFEPRNSARSLFVREVCAAALEDGRQVQCWIYAYRRPIGAASRIPHGRYDATSGEATS